MVPLARSCWSLGLNMGFSESFSYCLVDQKKKERLDEVVIGWLNSCALKGAH